MDEKRRLPVIGFYNVSVLLTYIGLVSGVCGLFAAMEGRVPAALLFLLFSGGCDMFDGKIARLVKRSAQACSFGIQIDSLSDIVCFGALPAAICWAAGVRGAAGAAALSFYVLCGLIRLAYFNVTEEERQKTAGGKRRFYQGLPISAAGALVPAFFLLRGALGAVFAPAAGAFMTLLALLFVLNFRCIKPGNAFSLCLLGAGVALAVCYFLGGV